VLGFCTLWIGEQYLNAAAVAEVASAPTAALTPDGSSHYSSASASSSSSSSSPPHSISSVRASISPPGVPAGPPLTPVPEEAYDSSRGNSPRSAGIAAAPLIPPRMQQCPPGTTFTVAGTMHLISGSAWLRMRRDSWVRAVANSRRLQRVLESRYALCFAAAAGTWMSLGWGWSALLALHSSPSAPASLLFSQSSPIGTKVFYGITLGQHVTLSAMASLWVVWVTALSSFENRDTPSHTQTQQQGPAPQIHGWRYPQQQQQQQQQSAQHFIASHKSWWVLPFLTNFMILLFATLHFELWRTFFLSELEERSPGESNSCALGIWMGGVLELCTASSSLSFLLVFFVLAKLYKSPVCGEHVRFQLGFSSVLEKQETELRRGGECSSGSEGSIRATARITIAAEPRIVRTATACIRDSRSEEAESS
jgi:hypothetical protein